MMLANLSRLIFVIGIAVALAAGGCSGDGASCVSDDECDVGATCLAEPGVSGMCVADCISDRDCGSDQRCVTGVCVTPCLGDDSCSGGLICGFFDADSSVGMCMPRDWLGL